MKIKLINLLFLFSSLIIFSQKKIKRVLWNNIENKPIEYATIKEGENYTISNENGVFKIRETLNKINIQSLIYEKLITDFDFLKNNDTIYLKPLTYELDEIIIGKNSLYGQMRKNVLKNYALDLHKEKFFLRAVIRKNNEFYKIIDFSGLVEKKTLFDTKQNPMPKKNYKIQIDNIRKVGIENRDIGFEMFSFKEFFTHLIDLSFNEKAFNISYEETENKDFTKIILDQKEKGKVFIKGYYILDKEDNFKETNITWTNNSSFFKEIRKTKFKTTSLNWVSKFERNKKTNKLQLNKGIIKGKTIVITNEVKDIYDVNYIYVAKPIENSVKLKKTINIKKDMFELKGDYDSQYWKNHEFLTLTDEMQKFINMINSSGKNSDFKTETNIE